MMGTDVRGHSKKNRRAERGKSGKPCKKNWRFSTARLVIPLIPGNNVK